MRIQCFLGIAAILATLVACENESALRTPRGAFDPAGEGPDAGDTGSSVLRDAAIDAGADVVPTDRPVARISVPALVNAGDEIRIDGSGSTPSHGGALVFAWRVVAADGGLFALRDENKATAVVRFLTRGRFRVLLVVSEAGVESLPAEALIEADDAAVRPVARAGVDQEVTVGTLVTLDGAGSHDPNGDALTYNWTVLEGDVGAAFDVHAAQPKFAATTPHATYRFSLVVSDGMHLSARDEVEVRVKNSPPEISGVTDRSVHMKTIPLNVTAIDKDGDALTYAWEFVSTPPGSTAAIVDPAARVTSFVADVLGTYELRVKVGDGRAESAATMRITPYNTAPGIGDGAATPADMAHRCSGNRCTATTKLAVNVFDADDTDLAVAFKLARAPNAKVAATFCAAPTTGASSRAGWTRVECDVAIEAKGATASDPAPAIAGNYAFDATVTDSFGASRSVVIDAVVQNETPTVSVTAPAAVSYAARRDAQDPSAWNLTATDVFSATVADPEGGLKSAVWRVVDVPAGVTLTLGAPTGATQSFTVSVTSRDVQVLKRFVSNGYTLEFQASDVNDATTTRRVSFAVVDRPYVWNGVDGATTVPHTTSVAGGLATVTTHYDLTAKATDPNGRIAHYSWSVGGTVVGASAAARATFDLTSKHPASQPVPASDRSRAAVVTVTDFKGESYAFSPVMLEVGNDSPRFSGPRVQSKTGRLCETAAQGHRCVTEFTLAGHVAGDIDGDPVAQTSAADGFTSVGAISVEPTPAGVRVVEVGRFAFGQGPYAGPVTLKLTATDIFGAAVSVNIATSIDNIAPPAPVSTLAAVNEFFACDDALCFAVLAGNLSVDFGPYGALLDDGDRVRVVASLPSPATFTRRSGEFYDCEPDTSCSGFPCGGGNPTRYKNSAPIAFSNRWVVAYPKNQVAPTGVDAYAEDWSGARSQTKSIALALDGAATVFACKRRIDWLVP